MLDDCKHRHHQTKWSHVSCASVVSGRDTSDTRHILKAASLSDLLSLPPPTPPTPHPHTLGLLHQEAVCQMLLVPSVLCSSCCLMVRAGRH